MSYEDQLLPGFNDESTEAKTEKKPPEEPRGFINLLEPEPSRPTFFHREKTGPLETCPQCEIVGGLGCPRHKK